MPQSTPKRAFALVELAVVFALLAVLASILFPVFLKARQNAAKTGCVSNLQRIGVAWKQYARDYDGRLMRFATSSDSAASKVTAYWWGSWDKTRLKPEAGLLYPYLKDVRVYACPAFPIVAEGNQGSMGYGYNAGYLSPTRYGEDYTEAIPVAVALAEVKQPDRTVAFADAAQFATTRTDRLRPSTYLSTPRSDYPNFHGRHDGQGNVLFCDGHIKALTPVYRQGTFGLNYSGERFKASHLGDLDEDGNLETNELFVLDKKSTAR